MPVNYKVGGENYFDNNYVRREFFGEGNLWTWGYNGYGQLGNNASSNINSPVQTIFGGITWKTVSAGYDSMQAIKTDGTLWVWGNGLYGALGTNAATPKSSPVQTVSGGTDWKSVAGGFYTAAAIKTDATLWTWGYNGYGQLGDGTRTNKSSPVQVGTGKWWKAVAMGNYSTAAIKSDGTLWTWGLNNVGQLGVNSTSNYSSPVQTTAGGTDWKMVSVGVNMMAAIKTDGSLWTWGLNQEGQLGLGFTNYPGKSTPVQVGTDTTWKQVSACDRAMGAVKTDGSLWIWGSSVYNTLGFGDSTSYSSPTQMPGMGWRQVTIGERQGGSNAIKSDGTLWGWGNASSGLGVTVTPVQMGTATNWRSVTQGAQGRIGTAITYAS